MANSNLSKAKNAKNDEFYTQYQDIEKEIMAYLDFNPNTFEGKTILLPCDDPEWSNFTKFFAQNFERLKLKKLISTSFAPDSKSFKSNYAPTLFETTAPQFDKTKTILNGKIFTLDNDTSGDGKIDVNDLQWTYLEGDGDFKSDEVIKLRDEADIIITNPPFSLFRDFLSWVVEANKKFVLVSNMNAITYKEVFILIKDNKMWMGMKSTSQAMFFNTSNKEYAIRVSNERPEGSFWRNIEGQICIGINNSCWLTNLDHGRRHQAMPLMTMEDNLKFSKHKEIKNVGYQVYENYNAIEISYIDAIPSDYDGEMGVPVSFLNKYCPEQFEIVGSNLTHGIRMSTIAEKGSFSQGGPSFYLANGDGTFKRIYTRILIKHKKSN